MKNYQCKKCVTHVTSGKTPSGFNWKRAGCKLLIFS